MTLVSHRFGGIFSAVAAIAFAAMFAPTAVFAQDNGATAPTTAPAAVSEPAPAPATGASPAMGYSFDDTAAAPGNGYAIDTGAGDSSAEAQLDALLADEGEEAHEKNKLDITGYYRVRWQYLDQPDQLNDAAPDALNYAQHRLWLHPSLALRNEPKITLDADVLVGEDTRPCADPRFTAVQPMPCTGILGGNGVTILDTNSADRAANISVLRLWGQATTPVGAVRAGRRSSHWGLGAYSNDGQHATDFGDPHYADTYDTLTFATKPLGPESDLLLALVGDQVVEGSPVLTMSGLDGNSDDVYQGVVVLLYNTEPLKAGAYQVFRVQDVTKSKIYATDIYGELDIGLLFLGFEAVWQYGNSQGLPNLDAETFTLKTDPDDANRLATVDINQSGWAFKAGVRTDKIEVKLNMASASGDADEQELLDNEVNGLTLNPNYQLSMIMFPYANANRVERKLAKRSASLAFAREQGKTNLTPEQFEQLKLVADLSRTKGGIGNAFVIDPVITYKPIDKLTTRLGWAWAQHNRAVLVAGAAGPNGVYRDDIGWELDAGVQYSLADGVFELGLDYAHFRPGEALARPQTILDEATGVRAELPGELIATDPANMALLKVTYNIK